MLHQLDIYGKDRVQTAIETMQFFEPKDGSGYYLAFSGGKDSVVLKAIADLAGVKYDAHYNVTSVDPPELVRFIKRNYPDVIFDHPIDEDGKPITMWSLIRKKKYPPTRIARYCCAKLKETNGMGRTTATGVRWAESTNRRKNQGRVTIPQQGLEVGRNFLIHRGGVALTEESFNIILNNDNDDRREVLDFCIKQRKTVVNPIIDWEDSDVWEFIEEYDLPYCSLYDEGFKRLGCIGCPLGGRKSMMREFERWPKYKELYIKAMDDCVKAEPERYKREGSEWNNGQDMFDWWIGETKGEKKDGE